MYLVIYVKNREPFVMGSFDTEEKAKKAMTDDFKETYEQILGMNFDDLTEDEILSGCKASDNSVRITTDDNEFDWKIVELPEKNKGKEVNKQGVKGYKVFNPDWMCRNKQYSCPGKFEEDINISVCEKGMHFCKKAADCFDYYSFSPENHVAEVIAYGDVKEKGDKCCTNKLEIVREISWSELLDLVNMGKGCTGVGNRGNYNRGNYNRGNYNRGNCNSGNRNRGNYNRGDYNRGDRNRGNYNRGNCNSGNYNKTNYSNGWFNTKEPKIPMFNKISEWTNEDAENSEANKILAFLAGSTCEWIYAKDMTDEEKRKHPEYETIGGYLKPVDIWKEAVDKWRSITKKEKAAVMSIPNFDKEIFKDITGIDVDCEDSKE